METYHLTDHRGAFLCGAGEGVYIPIPSNKSFFPRPGRLCRDCLDDVGNVIAYDLAAEEAAALELTLGEWCLACDGEGYTITGAGKEKRCQKCQGKGRTGL